MANEHPCYNKLHNHVGHRSRVYADGRQHYCERCREKIDQTTFSNIPHDYVTTHDAGDYNKPRPAAPFEGLETVTYRAKFRSEDELQWRYYPAPDSGFDPEKYEEQELVTRSQAEVIIAAKVEQERLRFEGELDKWMKTIGAGITGYQPEAYALMDLACDELVKLRADNAAGKARYSALEEIAAGLVERTDKAEADNAALTARVKELELIRDSHSRDTLQALREKQALETQLAAAKDAHKILFGDKSMEGILWPDLKPTDLLTINVQKQIYDKARAALECRP